MEKEIIPVFILGAPRNGTTWLGNTLGKIEEAFCPQHELHHGFHESNILRYKRYYGDISNTEDYINCLEDYSSSDYFKLAEGNKEYFYKNRKKSFFQVYLKMMDRYCKKHEKKFWVTKLDPMFFVYNKEWQVFKDIINERYKDIKYIGIKRNFEDYFKSYVYMEGENFQRRVSKIYYPVTTLLGVARYSAYYDKIDKIIKQQNSLFIDFADFKKDHENQLKRISEYLPTKNTNWITKPDKYKPNSSFAKKKERTLEALTKIFISIYRFILGLFPSIAILVLTAYEKIKGEERPGYRKLIKAKYFPDKFMKELDDSSAYQIKEKVRSMSGE